MGVTFLALTLETVKYPGLIGKYLYVDAKVYFALSVFLIIFLKSNKKFMKLLLKINKVFLVVTALMYLFFVLLEGANYTNYVLSRYHLHLSGLVTLVLFSLSVFLANKFKDEIPKSVKVLGILYPVTVFLLIFFMVKNLSLVSNLAFNRDSYILFHLGSSYDERLSDKWGIFYKFMVFVRNNTPTNAIIVIPPEQDPWLMGSGNDNFVRAFLYPRKVISQTIIIPEEDIKSFGPNTYILITWGKESCRVEPECHGWPRQDIIAKKVIYKNPDTSEVAEIKENIKYTLRQSKFVYGIMEL